jgi:aspartate aminotransferase-like enzyme/predicted N-acetyltransferase YhbS
MEKPICYQTASEPWHYTAIDRLNHRAFAEEIPQHAARVDGHLRDRFHAENQYIVALRGTEVIGMLALRGCRPFSLDQRLGCIDPYLPAGQKWVEVRLLAVEKAWRKHYGVFLGLLRQALQDGAPQGYTGVVISGTTRQLKLYRHLGFQPFGHLVGTEQAAFQPMYVLLSELLKKLRNVVPQEPQVENFLPGPVAVSPAVHKALQAPFISHRTQAFLDLFEQTRRGLCALTHATAVQVFTGSGTTANEVVAAQIRQWAAPGLIVDSGEFGKRLVRQGKRWGLDFEVFRSTEGAELAFPALENRLRTSASQWLWLCHCETSTGVLHNLPALRQLCNKLGVRLCLDCTSSLGVVPLDLRGVSLAAASSGKGLAAVAGLALVFHAEKPLPAPNTPESLDLATYAANQGIPYTLNSRLVAALEVSLAQTDWESKFRRLEENAPRMRQKLAELGFGPVAASGHENPAVWTLKCLNSRKMGDALKASGYHCSYESANLLERNWLQICLMGAWTDAALEGVLRTLPKAAN